MWPDLIASCKGVNPAFKKNQHENGCYMDQSQTFDITGISITARVEQHRDAGCMACSSSSMQGGAAVGWGKVLGVYGFDC